MMVAAFGMGPWGFCLGTEAQIDFYNLKYILSAIDNRPSIFFSPIRLKQHTLPHLITAAASMWITPKSC
jgi:hypothetical protein